LGLKKRYIFGVPLWVAEKVYCLMYLCYIVQLRLR